MIQTKVKFFALLGALTFFMSCSDNDMSDVEPSPEASPFQELYDQGIDRYLGVFTPNVSEVVEPGLTEHIFSGASLATQLTEAATELNDAFPERFQSLISVGDEHTFIIRRFDFQIGNTTVRQWITDMLEGTTTWNTLIE